MGYGAKKNFENKHLFINTNPQFIFAETFHCAFFKTKVEGEAPVKGLWSQLHLQISIPDAG